MTNREYLSQALNLQKEIDQLNSELSDGYVSPQLAQERVQKTGGNAAEANAIRQVILHEKISKLIAEKMRLLIEITYTIDKVEDAQMRLILHKRYIQGERVRDIAAVMHYERESMFRLLRQAEEMITQP